MKCSGLKIITTINQFKIYNLKNAGMMRRKISLSLFFIAGFRFAAAAGTLADTGLFSMDARGCDALRGGAYLQAIDELRKDSSAIGLFKLAIAYLRSGDTAKALSSLSVGPVKDTAVGPFAWEMIGDITDKKFPDSALASYGRALQAALPARYRSRIFEKIGALTVTDTVKIASAPFWTDYSLWWNTHRPLPPEPLCAAIDSCISCGAWPQIDSLVTHDLTALSDSAQCAIVNSLGRSPQSDSALSAATLFLLGRIALDCGRLPLAERRFAASRQRPDFAAAVDERLLLRFRGRLSFNEKKYEEAIAVLSRSIQKFGYESDLGLLVARSFKSLNKNDEAATWYDRFIEHTPRYPAMAEILWRRAWIEETRGHPKAAEGFYQKICKYYPRSSRAEESFVRHALCFYREEKYDAALQKLALFETKNPDSPLLPEARYWKAKCLLGLNKLDTAKVKLAELARQEPYDYYAHRARDLLILLGDSIDAHLFLDTVSDNDRALHWLDSAATPSAKPLLPEDSLTIRRGLICASIGTPADAEMFLEPVELAYPENLSLEFRIAAFYRSIGAMPQAARSGRRLAWRIPPESRDAIPLTVYSVMYPFYYSDIVNSEAPRRGINPAFVLAVIRQESIFNPAIVSSAGAIGLMQIMPSTGALLARELAEPFSVDTLYRPSANIRYGTLYLRKLLDQFNENEVLALASYNGGPPNAKEWYARNKDKDFDLFVEDIDFSETRNYVKKVLANYWFYRKLSRIGHYCHSR
jgi:soluble lytic murein transglycosylase-like protein/TolA-binding protein